MELAAYRLTAFAQQLCLRPRLSQIYPANTEQASMMTNAAMRAGFSGGLVVDFPHRCLRLDTNLFWAGPNLKVAITAQCQTCQALLRARGHAGKAAWHRAAVWLHVLYRNAGLQIFRLLPQPKLPALPQLPLSTPALLPCSTRAKKYFLVLMVGGTAALPQARGMDGEEPEDEEAAEVYVGHRKTKRRKHNDKVGRMGCRAVRSWGLPVWLPMDVRGG